MKITFKENVDFDFYIKKKWYKFLSKEIKDLPFEEIKGILERFPYRRFRLDLKDVASVKKTEDSVILIMKDGREIRQRKPEELRFDNLIKKMDLKKIQIGIFMKNIITHYSGGRYWSWLLGHILADARDVQVTFITNEIPPFGNSFDCYNKDDVFVYLDDPKKNPYDMGNKISKNVFDYVVGIPIEGGVAAKNYAEKWNIPFYCMIFESPNFIREYRNGSDTNESFWTPYRDAMMKCNAVINNTEMGKGFLDKWMPNSFDKEKSVWLWNSMNTVVADKVKQAENKNPNEYHIVFIGRSVGFKRTIHIVRALNMLPDIDANYEGVKFVIHIISGHGSGLIDQMNAEKKEHIEVEYHEKVDDYEKFRIVKICNMMIFLSCFEGYGIPPSEAMYCERLCISYPLPILEMIYKDNLVYSEDGNIEELAKTIIEWLPDSDRKKKHIAKAKEYIDGVVSHERVRQEFFDIIKCDVNDVKKDPNIVVRSGRLTFGMIVCNGDQFIWENLNHIYDVADEIIICEGAVAKFSPLIGSDYSTDKTWELIQEFRAQYDQHRKKIVVISSRDLQRPWDDKKEMQNAIAEKTKGRYFIKQDVDEFYNIPGLLKEIDRLANSSRFMTNYRSYHFWGDTRHIIKGANFNDKQTRVWKWDPDFRYLKTINWVSNVQTGELMAPSGATALISNDTLFHYSYLYNNKARKFVLNYYRNRKLGDHKDVYEAWIQQEPRTLKEGRNVQAVSLEHPISIEALKKIAGE